MRKIRIQTSKYKISISITRVYNKLLWGMLYQFTHAAHPQSSAQSQSQSQIVGCQTSTLGSWSMPWKI